MLRPVAIGIAGLLVVLLVVSLASLVKITLPRGLQIWLYAGQIVYVTPSGRFAELTANSRRLGFSADLGFSFSDWRFTALRPSRSGTWIQSFVWLPLLPLVVLFGGIAGALYLLERRGIPGLCRRCGYSRAGLPRGASCPECGQTAA